MDDRKHDRDMAQDGLENQVKGKAKEVEGKVRGDIGDATDNASEHLKGRAKEMQGKVQKKFGEAEENLSDDDREDRVDR
ncbi:MAG TPA: CsbD family protein [Gemmatimonadaceae bacterium]